MEVALQRNRRSQFHLLRALVEYVCQPIVVGALVSVSLVGIGTLLAYSVQIFISRTLGLQEYGTYAYVLAIINVLALVASLDLGSAALRFVGFYNSARQWHLFNGFVRTSRVLVLSLSTAAAATGALVAILIRGRLELELLAALLAGCVFLVPASLMLLQINLHQAMRRIYEVRIPNMFVRPIALVLVLYISTRFFGADSTASTAILANAAGMTIALVLSAYLWNRIQPAPAREASPVTRPREWLQFSGVMLGTNLLYMLLSDQLGVIIVGTLLGTTEAALLAVSSLIASLITFGVLTVNHFASAHISEYQDRRGDAGLRTLVRRLMLLNLALSMPLMGSLLLGGHLLLFTFGPEFVVAYPVLVVLSIGYSVNASWAALWGTLLTMTGFQKEAAVLVAIAAALNVTLTIVLVPRIGIIGAAAATTTALMVRGVLLAVVVHHRLGFWPWTVGCSRRDGSHRQ